MCVFVQLKVENTRNPDKLYAGIANGRILIVELHTNRSQKVNFSKFVNRFVAKGYSPMPQNKTRMNAFVEKITSYFYVNI